jgi:hypothetical protein
VSLGGALGVGGKPGGAAGVIARHRFRGEG